MNYKIVNENAVKIIEAKAKEMRREMVRMVKLAGSGHLAPALSCADVIASLFFKVMKINPENPRDDNRDRFILSAGHKALALYTAMALAGYFSRDVLDTFLKFDSMLGGHPDSTKIPGIEISTGSLGHGLPIGVGMGLGEKLKKQNNRVFVLLSDGEVTEGSNWEAASAASHYKLDNLIGIIDKNGLCADGDVCNVMGIEPLDSRWTAFGWEVREIDGHNVAEIITSLKSAPIIKNKPTMIIANTIKGKGISFMENRYEWHNKVPSDKQFEIAFKELA